MRRKILMGVLAVALPTGLLAVTQGAAVAKPSPNPISCSNISATLVFAGAETTEGVPTTSHTASGSTSVTSSTFSCSPGSGSTGTLSIPGGKNLKNSKYSKSACSAAPTNTTVCDKFVQDSWAEFQAAGGSLKKSLKTISVTVNGNSDTLKVKSSSEVVGSPCGGGEVGFQISGEDLGHYYDKTASLLVCLGSDTRADHSTGFFTTDFLTDNGGGVISANIDPTTSSGTF